MIRIAFTVVITGVYLFLIGAFTPVATLIAGKAAGQQFENSDLSYLQAIYTMNVLSGIGLLLTSLFLLTVAAIWWAPVRKLIAQITAAVLAFGLLAPGAHAFFEKADRTEAYTIMPNESAFWIPDVGASSSQAQLESEAFLNEKKLAVKRFIIPHQKLSGSGGWAAWDYYVPAGRLIIVDRTPYSREWVDADDRGTSKKKEGFPCQSKEGINITVGISIGTSVTERDAAKFLYRFGVTPPKGDRTDGNVIFTSVYNGRSLEQVMDDVGRKKVQTLVCGQIGNRTFDAANDEAGAIIAAVEEASKTYFAAVGITLDFIGWGDTFEFDKDVQAAVNRRYVATQDEKVAAMLAPHAATIQALAAADALRAFGFKTDGKLPTTIVGLPTELGSLLGTLLRSAPGGSQ